MRILSLLILLAASPVAKAFTCDDLFSSYVKSTIRVPERYRKGEALLSTLLKSEWSKTPSRDSVWFDFTRDRRYNQWELFADPVREAIAFVEGVSGMEVGRGFLFNSRQLNQQIPPRFFVTWDSLGIRTINRMVSKRIFPLGLIEHGMNLIVDGRPMTLVEYFGHDISHSYLIEMILNTEVVGSERNFSWEFYSGFDYDKILSGLSSREKLYFDLGYYLYIHEANAPRNFGSPLAQAKTVEELRQVYKAEHSGKFGFSFDHGLKVSITSPQFPLFKGRLLNQNDLWKDLPIEVRRKIETDPGQTDVVLKQFLSDVFTVFFREHYKHALSWKGFSVSSPQ